MLTLLMMMACSGATDDDKDTTDDSDGTTDTETDSANDSPTVTTPPCTSISSGEDWFWNGECPQMRTPCEIEVTECSFTIAYSSGMTMGMPDAGTIDGDTVTFQDAGSVRGCTGTIIGEDEIEGSCADGCTFTLKR